jgi:hypothetical protein
MLLCCSKEKKEAVIAKKAKVKKNFGLIQVKKAIGAIDSTCHQHRYPADICMCAAGSGTAMGEASPQDHLQGGEGAAGWHHSQAGEAAAHPVLPRVHIMLSCRASCPS